MEEDPGPARGAGADRTLIVADRVLTMDPSTPTATAVVIAAGRIVEVGGDELARSAGVTRRIELGDRTVAPGFIDAHNHLSIAALNPRWRDVRDVATVEELRDAVRLQAEREPEAAWIRVAGWDESRRGVQLTRHDLDGLGLDRPILVAHSSLHMGVVDGAGLDELAIGRSSADPAGGEIGRDSAGEPNGVLIERAWSEAHRRSLAAYADPDRWADHIAVRSRTLLAEGITAVHDAACSPEAEAVFTSLARSGELPVSVLAMPHPAALLSHRFGPRIEGPVTGEGDEQLRVGPLKLFADGGVAIGLDVTMGGHPIRMGLTMDDLTATAVDAASKGWRLAVHAIGNVGVDRAIEAFRAVATRHPDADHRFRVEHALVTSPRHGRDLASLGAIAVVQPGFVEHVGTQSHGASFDEHRWLAFADLAEAGVRLAASSDDPCAPFPPIWCAGKGISRTTDTGIALDVDQSLSLDAWLHAYTAGAATAGGQEAERGSITPGKRADLVVLEGPLADPSKLRVDQTWVAGRPVHGA